ncbi:MAG: hypothetical protein HDR02_17200 [Lachnospiraceae bacterium]|nr:hypothetical protein [Lachnospiraceae bacterium]
MKVRNRYRELAIGCLLALFLMAGCGEIECENRDIPGEGNQTETVQSEEETEAFQEEEQDTLIQELDGAVEALAEREILWDFQDLMQDERAANFPEELVTQLQEALAAGTSDELLREMTDNSLKIERTDFIYQPTEVEESSGSYGDVWAEINELLSSEPGKSVPYDFYRLDLDGDGTDEILMVERTRYNYSYNSRAVVLEQDERGHYCFAGYERLGYYRLYALFSYEDNIYLICNFDNYKKKTTRALGIFDLGESWEKVYLSRSSTDCQLEKLWESEQEGEQELQTAIWDYMQQIGLDLMLYNRSDTRFPGEERLFPREERQQAMAVLDNALWTPEHLGYTAQEQRWIFTLEEQQVYFALYHRDQPEQYLVEAFLSEGEQAAPIGLYGIFPRIEVDLESYWSYMGKMEYNSEEQVFHSAPEAALAFPEERSEVTEKLWRQVNEELLSEEMQGQQLAPEGLVNMAREALFTRDWSAFDQLAEPFEQTDQEAVLAAWFPGYDYSMDGYINRIYQYAIGDDTYLLFMVDSGGSARFMINACYRLTSEGREYLGDQWNTWWNDYVVPYEGEFYLVDGNYNFYSKYVDTIYLHRLTAEGISEDATKVVLSPVSYVWTDGYKSDDAALEQIDRYVEEIGEELMEVSPINDDVDVYIGCEEPVTDAVLRQRLLWSYDWYRVDYDNDGRSEYLARHYWYPSNSTTLGLLTERYRLDGITVQLYESWEPECPYSSYDYELIQLWYQEFDGKIYTFQLFLTEGYNYYLSVSLVEGGQVSWIASYYVTPRCEWQLETRRNYTGAG